MKSFIYLMPNYKGSLGSKIRIFKATVLLFLENEWVGKPDVRSGATNVVQ